MPVEVVRASEETLEPFFGANEREALRSFYGFNVVWHEQRHWFAAQENERTEGAAQIAIAASLAHVERIVVEDSRRGRGIGRALLEAAAETANYYNCHKMSVMVPHGGGAQRFFERCGYKQEAVLPQHTFKLDIAVLRKFLL